VVHTNIRLANSVLPAGAAETGKPFSWSAGAADEVGIDGKVTGWTTAVVMGYCAACGAT
jgi:hypothetical protein